MQDFEKFKLFLESHIHDQKSHIEFLEKRISLLNDAQLPVWTTRYKDLLAIANYTLDKYQHELSELTGKKDPDPITVIHQVQYLDNKEIIIRVQLDQNVYRIIFSENSLILLNASIQKQL